MCANFVGNKISLLVLRDQRVASGCEVAARSLSVAGCSLTAQGGELVALGMAQRMPEGLDSAVRVTASLLPRQVVASEARALLRRCAAGVAEARLERHPQHRVKQVLLALAQQRRKWLLRRDPRIPPSLRRCCAGHRPSRRVSDLSLI